MLPSKSILFLTLNTFSTTGGIEDVCRTFCRFLEISELKVKTLCINDSGVDENYIQTNKFEGFSGKKWKFGLACIKQSFFYNTIVLSHINLLLFAKLIKILNPKTKIILFAHGIEVWRPLPKWKINFLKKHVTIWSVSNFTSSELQNRHHLPSSKITVLNNSLNPFFRVPSLFKKPEHLLAKYNLQESDPVLFTLSRITKHEGEKGYKLVIDLMPKLLQLFPKLKYIIGGKANEDENQVIKKLIREKNLEHHVILPGFVERELLTDHFLLADCFILPSKKEGFGMVFIESAACGCETIGGNKDGSVDALLDGKLGTLIDPDNPEQILDAIIKTLKIPKTIERSLEIQQLCVEHFGFSAYISKVNKLLDID